MRILRHPPDPAARALAACVVAACVVAACAACSEAPSAPAAGSSLHATWEAPVMMLQPQGTLRATLSLAPDGRFSWRTVSYGVYAGEPATRTSAWTRSDGTYAVSGDSLVFRVDSLTTWDSFYGEPEPSVLRPYPYGGLFDDCRFTVQGDVLVLRFTTYPLDAPVPAVAVYGRRPTILFD